MSEHPGESLSPTVNTGRTDCRKGTRVAIERAQALVIEDSPEITLLVRGLLEKEGYSVVATPRGTPALGGPGAEKPELVILDLSLPDRDGVEICRELRSQRRVRRHGDRARRRGRQDRRSHRRRRRLRHQAVLAARAGGARPCDAPPTPRDDAQQEVRDFGHLVVDPSPAR